MNDYKEFRKKTLEVATTWELFEPHKGFQKLYLKFMHRRWLICRVRKKLRAYKRKIPIIEAVETIIEPDNRVEIVNVIRKNQGQSII